MNRRFTNQRSFVASLVCLLYLSTQSFTAFAQSQKRNETDWLNEQELEITVYIPPFKPDGKRHDAKSDFAQATLDEVGSKGLLSFLEAEAPPDPAFLKIERGNSLVQIVGSFSNRYEATFSIKGLPRTFAIVLLDLDGPLNGKQSYHDFLAALILSAQAEALSDKVREKLIKKVHRMLRKIGVHEREYPEQSRLDGGQIPKRFPVFNLQECMTRKCTFTAYNGVVLRLVLKARE